MSFQSYLDNIKTQTGKTPADFKKLAERAGILKKDIKAGDLVQWLKKDFDLGHGHAMAIWASFKNNGWVKEKAAAPKKTTTVKTKAAPVKEHKEKGKENGKSGKSLVDQYIAGFPAATQALLEKMRAAIQKVAPAAEQTIGYGIPTFKLNGNLVHFAGYDNHIGFYPGPAGIANFEAEISKYTYAKGSVQFPLDKPLPLALVTKITKFRVAQNEAKKKK